MFANICWKENPLFYSKIFELHQHLITMISGNDIFFLERNFFFVVVSANLFIVLELFYQNVFEWKDIFSQWPTFDHCPLQFLKESHTKLPYYDRIIVRSRDV